MQTAANILVAAIWSFVLLELCLIIRLIVKDRSEDSKFRKSMDDNRKFLEHVPKTVRPGSVCEVEMYGNKAIYSKHDGSMVWNSVQGLVGKAVRL